MALKLGMKQRQEYYGRLDTGIGVLYVVHMQIKDLLALEKQLNRSVKECDPEQYIRNLAIFVCYPENALIDRQRKPKAPILSQDDVKQLTSSELDEIARIFVGHNDYLYKKDDAILYPKNEEESYMEYLHRLSVIEEEEQGKLFSSLSGRYAKSLMEKQNNLAVRLFGSGFSAGLSDKIGNTLSLGSSLGKAMEIGKLAAPVTPLASGKLGSLMESIDRINRAARIDLPKIELPELEKIESIDLAGIERRREEKRREPFNELAKRLDRLIELSEKNIEFAVQVNETQTEISAEIKSSSDITEKFSKRNFVINLIVAALTALSISVAIMIFFDASRENEISQNILLKVAKEIDGLERQLAEHDVLFERNLEMMEALRKINDEYGKRMEQSTDKSNELERARGADIHR
uniref:Uncharacterized protein n=1 Tax=Candidatus Kentrum sp. LFY TaxID=2126342 RepID=A0A450U5Z7_9GAMM|nr:MAG: hypothetical protein BECKLFY1418B_GA0070995_100488 [Candidatus Kentron sp. LFY]